VTSQESVVTMVTIRPLYVLWGNTAYCVKLGGEDLSHYSNEI